MNGEELIKAFLFLPGALFFFVGAMGIALVSPETAWKRRQQFLKSRGIQPAESPPPGYQNQRTLGFFLMLSIAIGFTLLWIAL